MMLISGSAMIFIILFNCVYFQVASFTGEKQAVSTYKKFLADAYKSGVHEGLVGGIGFAMVLFVMFCGYGLSVWFGAKMIMERGYGAGAVVNVFVAVLNASM